MMQLIDPIESILMDFFASFSAANPDGKTSLIHYDEWAKKIYDHFNCACGEPFKERIHGKEKCIIVAQ
jgi:hypothetical protein